MKFTAQTWLRSHRRRGFTAIEITMVATIIAIIALLILPMFRSRADMAKQVAAQDELDSIVKAAVLASADTGNWFRLQDMDNGTQFNLVPNEPDLEVPIAYWNRPITEAERTSLANPQRWQGPYLAFKKTTTLGELLTSNYPALWRNGGPILHIGNGGAPATTLGNDSDDDRYPVDPWGSPYIFFAPGRLGNTNSGLVESTFGNGAVYSLGPNGVPGDQLNATSQDFLRETGFLGTGDDFKFIF